MPRPIDHLVIAVPDLGAAAALYRAVGFEVGGVNRHPWGTENAVVALDGSYLELIGLAAGYRPPEPDDPAAPFAGLVAAAVARGGGLAAVALGSDDADADAEAFRAAGLGAGRRLDFARGAEGPGGARRTLRFGLAFAEVPGLPGAGLFACRHHQPFGDGPPPRHRNGALRLDAAVLAVDDPRAAATPLAPLFGAPPDGPADRPGFATPTGRLDLLSPAGVALRYGFDPAPGRFAALALTVEDPAGARAALAGAGVAHRTVAGAAVVPPGAAFGAALAFAPAACHSDR